MLKIATWNVNGVRARSHDVLELIERLSNRLGDQAVLRPQLWPDAQPEYACRLEPWMRPAPAVPPRAGRAPAPEHTPGLAPRKDWMLLRPPCLKSRPIALPVASVSSGGAPRRFHWQGQEHLVARTWGPERIETGWWRGTDVQRDYYVIETTEGIRWSVFHRLDDGRWFLHGCFD